MHPHVPLFRRLPRMTTFILLAVALLLVIALVSPVQLPVVVYKLSLISLAAVVGYWLDRALFPYARPDSYLANDWRCGAGQCGFQHVDFPIAPEYFAPFMAACLRRAVVVAAVMIGVALGL